MDFTFASIRLNPVGLFFKIATSFKMHLVKVGFKVLKYDSVNVFDRDRKLETSILTNQGQQVQWNTSGERSKQQNKENNLPFDFFLLSVLIDNHAL